MDNSADQETESFLKNLCQPLTDCNSLLKEYGISFKTAEDDVHRLKNQKQTCLNQPLHRDKSTLKDLVESKLDACRKRLLGDIPLEELQKGQRTLEVLGIKKEEVELLEKLDDAACKHLPEQQQPDPALQRIRNARSLIDEYNISLPAWTPYLTDSEGDSAEFDWLKLLNKTLDDIPDDLPPSFESVKCLEDNTGQDEKIIGHTMENIAKLIALPFPGEKTTKIENLVKCTETNSLPNIFNEKAENSVVSKSEERAECTENVESYSKKEDLNTESKEKSDNHNVGNKRRKKKKKENEYVPKLIPINWSDPRNDPEFSKELEDIMQCDAFTISASNSSQPPELDDMAETVTLPALPRDIIKMLSATDEELADWEYSIKVEKEEVTEDEDDSELEEMENELRAITNSEKFMKFHKLSEQNTEKPTINEAPDVSEFLTVFMPPSAEDIMAKRDDTGEIITYEAVSRNEEEVVREFERLYLDLDSDTDEEDAEDDPEDKMYEIDWEKEKVKIKSNKLLGGPQGTISEFELKEKYKKIEEYIEIMKNEEAGAIDPVFEKRVRTVNQLLDRFGFPGQREIKEDTVEEFLEAQLQKYNFMFEAHKDMICPPGNLVAKVKPGDPDYDLALEQKSFKSEEHSIVRPSNLTIKLPDVTSESEEVDRSSKSGISTPEIEKKFEIPDGSRKFDNILFPSKDEIPDGPLEEIVSKTPPSIANEEKILTEPEEERLDNEFKKEYLRRGGTVDGLGTSIAPERSLNLETLESYSEKFLTFPYYNEHFGSFDFVRMRRVMANCFPELSNELYADLSKVENFETPELNISSNSDSDSSSDIEVVYKPDPFTTEELIEKKIENADECESDLPTADENENSDNDNPSPLPVQSESSVKKAKKKRSKRSMSEEKSSSESETDEKPEENKTLMAKWAPFESRPTPSKEGLLRNMEIIKEIIAPKERKFKVPRKLKDFIDGKYEPSKEDIRKWKQRYHKHFGDMPCILSKLADTEEYESLIAEVEEKLSDEEDTNPIVRFKNLLEEHKDSENEDIDDMESTAEHLNKSSVSSEIPEGNPDEENIIQTAEVENKQELTKDEVDESEKVADIMENKLKIDDGIIRPSNLKEEPIKEEETEAPHPPKIPVLRLRDVPRPLRKEEWAEEVNSNAKIELEGTPAMSYPFELDGFQKHAIKALEDGYNVFVSAHTSAGKTVVAEYAIAMSKRNRSKAVYTSPVKALSNQKYADFKRIFGSVGLITGDIQLNENAECLIMTTEILRSMLYNTSEKIRDLEFVVFDEVHYINDPERGHVWEEVLILLPPQVQIVMLSATVPNTLEFANWVGRTKQRKVMVCATHHRPVPLQHYIYTGTGGPSPGDTYLVKDGDGPFLVAQYERAETAMKAAQEKERKNRKKQAMKRAEEEREWKRGAISKPKPFMSPSDSQDKRDQTLWISVVSFLQKKDWLPAVVFVFSRKKCDVFADQLRNIDLTTKPEKSFIHRFIKSQVEKLDDVDQDLPQIKIMQSQLLQGIGVHHSGILPIMKEIVEVLFQEGKVKLLFATETFAMGVNMPARTVLFHSIKKFDGNGIRLLHPAEYIQMAGRAGRRGKDSAGNVIILAKPAELIARNDLETLMFGNPSKLISKFRLSYRMILNTLTMSGMLTVQSMMASSYCENQGQLKKKFVEKDLIEAEQFERSLKKIVNNNVSELDVEVMSKFYTYSHDYIKKWKDLRLQMICHGKIMKELQPGKLLKICQGRYINRTALLLETLPHKDPSIRFLYRVMILDQDIQYTRDITSVGMEMDETQLDEWYRLVSLMDNLPAEKEILSGPNEYLQLDVKPQEIVAVYKENLKLQKNQIQEFLTMNNNRMGYRNKISEVGDRIARQLWSSIGKNNEINESNHGFENFELCINVTEMWTLVDQIKKYQIRYNPLVLNSFKKVFRWKQAEEKVKSLRMYLSDENMILYPDFKNKKALLKEKEYIDDSDTVQIKGYMAARIGKYELIVCELLVENILVNMEPEEVAALLSFLVCRSNNSDHYPTSFKTLTPSLQEGIKKCQKIIKDVILLEKQFQIEDYEGSETSKLSFGLVPIMYAWVKQEPFKKIMELEELQEFEFQEGLLVRWIQQLLETLKEVEAAARVMGDPGVPTKLQAAGQRIKRGIVFAPSLYTTML